MKEHVLVVLRNGDDVEDMLHYLEDIARPGMIITFFIEHPLRGLENLITQLSDSSHPIPDDHFSAGGCARTTQAIATDASHTRVLLICQRLRKRGVKITVKVYTGNLKRLLREFIGKGSVQSIVMRQRRNTFWRSLLRLASSTGLTASASPTPFLLYRRKNTPRDSDVHQ